MEVKVMCMTKTNLLKNLERLEELKKNIAVLDKEKKSIEDMLKKNMEDQGKYIYEAGPYKVTYNEVTQNKLDQKALKEGEPEIYNKYLKESSYRKLLVGLIN